MGIHSFSGVMLPSGAMSRGTDNTQSKQKILEPMILPMAMSCSSFKTAMMHAVSSGKLVPIATMVRPIMSGLMLRDSAIFLHFQP